MQEFCSDGKAFVDRRRHDQEPLDQDIELHQLPRNRRSMTSDERRMLQPRMQTEGPSSIPPATHEVENAAQIPRARVPKNYHQQEHVNQHAVDRIVIKESRRIVEYDNEPQGLLKGMLKRYNTDDYDNAEIEVTEDEHLYSLEDIKMSSKKLSEKRRIGADLGLLMDKNTVRNGEIQDSKTPRRRVDAYAATAVDRVSLTLWNATLWRIQGRFGSTTASYFKFQRWTTFLNVINTFFVFALVMTPQVAFNVHTESDEDTIQCIGKGYMDTNVTFYPLANSSSNSKCCSDDYLDKIDPIAFPITNGTFWPSLKTFVVSILTGTNWMETTGMFYGYYSGTFEFTFKSIVFDFPLAYFLVMMAIFLINLTAVVVSSAKSVFDGIQQSFAREDGRLGLFPVIFGSWDYKINNEESVVIQISDIFGRINLALDSKSRRQKKDHQSQGDSRLLLAKRIFFNGIILGILGFTGYLIFNITATMTPDLLLKNKCGSTNIEDLGSSDHLIDDIQCFLIEYLPSIVVTLANITIPFLFTIIIEFEEYEPNTKLFLNLSRCIFLRLASLLITLLSLLKRVDCDYADGCLDKYGNITLDQDYCREDSPMYKTCSNVNLEGSECEKPICWETYIGQQFYKLTLVDFFVQVAIVFLFDAPRRWLIGHCMEGSESLAYFRNHFGVIQFNVTKHVLDIVYSQTICWLAIFYAPLITLVTVIKSFLLFYLRLFHVQYICSPSSVPYSASRASGFFKVCLLVSFGCSTVAVALFISIVQPSTACGPFRDVNCITPGGNTTDLLRNCLVFDYIEHMVTTQSSDGLQEILFFLSESTFLYCVCGLFVLIVYLYSSLSNADASLAKELKTECAIEIDENRKRSKILRDELKLLNQAMRRQSSTTSLNFPRRLTLLSSS